MTGSRLLAVVIVMISLWASSAATVIAAPRPLTDAEAARVMELVREAAQLRGAERYDDALAALKKALAIYPASGVYYNLGRTYEDAGRFSDAQEAYEHSDAAEPSPKLKTKIELALSRVRARLSKATLSVMTAPPGALVLIDDVELGLAPLHPFELTAGRHRVEARLAGHRSVVRWVELPGAGVISVELSLKPLPPGATAVDARAIEEPPERFFHLGLTFGEGLIAHGGQISRSHVSVELLPSLQFGWLRVDMGAEIVVEPPIGFVLRPGVRAVFGGFYARLGLQVLLTPITTTGMLSGVGAEIDLGHAWSLIAELTVSTWFEAVGVVPIDGRIGVSYGF